MKFLIDESTGQSVVSELRRLGHDVISIQEIFPGLDDPPILDIAGKEKRAKNERGGRACRVENASGKARIEFSWEG